MSARRAGIGLLLSVALATWSVLLAHRGSGRSETGAAAEAYGRLVVAVKWPQAESSARVIPEGTEVVRATVTASDIPSPIEGEVTKDDIVNEQARIELDVPSGTGRRVEGKALDSEGTVLACGVTTAEIRSSQPNEVRVVMTAGACGGRGERWHWR